LAIIAMQTIPIASCSQRKYDGADDGVLFIARRPSRHTVVDLALPTRILVSNMPVGKPFACGKRHPFSVGDRGAPHRGTSGAKKSPDKDRGS
jgi:hypothetical protein